MKRLVLDSATGTEFNRCGVDTGLALRSAKQPSIDIASISYSEMNREKHEGCERGFRD